MQDEKVTVQVAAKALDVTPKTIHQWLKSGTLSRVKEGNRTYILMDEVRTMREKRLVTSKDQVIEKEMGMTPGNNLVTVNREHYDGLLVRLGQLEAKQELLLEYKAGIEAKDKAITEAEQLLKEKNKVMERAGRRIQELQAEVERLNLPWYRRIFRTFQV